MTLSEVCEKYNISEVAFKKNFNRYQESILKKYGVKIIKEGRGSKAIYKEIIEKDNRAITMFDENKVLLQGDNLSLPSFDFITFLGLCSTPMLIFRGTKKDFLNYIEVENRPENIKSLEESLKILEEKDLILPIQYDDDIFICSIRRSAEKQLRIGIELIQKCKELANKEYERPGNKWINLMKVWLYIGFQTDNDAIFTLNDIAYNTGISKYAARECLKMLEAEKMFSTKFEYIKENDKIRCLGRSGDFCSFEGFDVFIQVGKNK